MSSVRSQLDKVRAPYNFVPQSARVVHPSWSDLASQDVPFEDGVCGELTLEIEAKTPVFIRGETKKRGGEHTDDLFFTSDEKGFYVPGTSLKGMLRAVLEVATFGKLTRITSDLYGIRDLHSRDVYGKHMADIIAVAGGDRRQGRGGGPSKQPVPLVSAGWLRLTDASDPDSDWVIEPCDFAKVEYAAFSQIAPEFGVKEYDPGPKQSAKDKYRKLGAGGDARDKNAGTAGARRVLGHTFQMPVKELVSSHRVSATGVPRVGSFGKVEGGGAWQKGTAVLTGQPSTWDPRRARKGGAGNPKHHDFFFFDAGSYDPIKVTGRAKRAFEHVHSDSGQQGRDAFKPNAEWGTLKPLLVKGGRVPVFFLLKKAESKGTQVFSIGRHPVELRAFGLAMMFRLAYDYSPADLALMQQSLGALEDRARPDLAETMFGYVPSEFERSREDKAKERTGRTALRGRVSVGEARVTIPVRALPRVTAVLNSPKPTFFPNYVEQSSDQQKVGERPGRSGTAAAWATYMKADAGSEPRLRGWKRYPARSTAVERPEIPAKAGTKVLSHFHPLPAGTRFRATVRVHNLRQVELGALLWAIDFGGAPGACHGLGMAKSLGYGVVRASHREDLASLRWNNQARDGAVDLDAAVAAFRGWMEHELETGHATGPGWERSRQIFELIAMAIPPESEEMERDLRHMRLDHPAFGNEFSAAKSQGLVLESWGGDSGWARWRDGTTPATPNAGASKATGSLLPRPGTPAVSAEPIEPDPPAPPIGSPVSPVVPAGQTPAAAPTFARPVAEPVGPELATMVNRLRQEKKSGGHIALLKSWRDKGGEIAERAREAGREVLAEDVVKWRKRGKQQDLVDWLG